MGLAEAKVEEAKKLAMYSGVEGERRARVEVAVALAEKLAGILKGVRVLPENAFIAMMDDGGKIPITLTDKFITPAKGPVAPAAAK